MSTMLLTFLSLLLLLAAALVAGAVAASCCDDELPAARRWLPLIRDAALLLGAALLLYGLLPLWAQLALLALLLLFLLRLPGAAPLLFGPGAALLLTSPVALPAALLLLLGALAHGALMAEGAKGWRDALRQGLRALPPYICGALFGLLILL